jgi:hypothetical protein
MASVVQSALRSSGVKNPKGDFYCRLKCAQRLPHGFPLYRESTFAEDYGSGKISLVLVFRAVGIDQIGTIDNSGSLYCSVISADISNVRNLYLRDEEAVLISKIEAVECIDEVSDKIPSFVRLYRIEKFPSESDDGLLFFSAFDELFKIFPGWIYRKSDLIRGDFAIRSSEFKPCEIEGCSQTVNSVSTEKSKALENLSVSKAYFDIFSAFRIYIRSHHVGCVIATENLGGIRIEFQACALRPV